MAPILKKIPVFRKKIYSFLAREDGKISKQNIIKAGVAAALISSMAGVASPAAEICEEGRVEHNNWCHGVCLPCCHTDSPVVFETGKHINDCPGKIAKQAVDEGSDVEHHNWLTLPKNGEFIGTHDHCAGHNQHCSHGSHASHGSHCSCQSWT